MNALPRMFLIRRKPLPLIQEYSSDTFALVETKTVRPALTFHDYTTFTLVKDPRDLLQGDRIYRHDPPIQNPISLEVYRASKRAFATRFFTIQIYFEPYEFRRADRTLTVPVLHIPNSTVILPSEFKIIGEGSTRYGLTLYFDHLLPQIQTPSPISSSRPNSAQKTVSALPQHLVNTVIEAAIEKVSSCPVSLEPLTKASARLTPCGHLVSHLAAEHWLSNAHSCPVCRQDLVKVALMKWVA